MAARTEADEVSAARGRLLDALYAINGASTLLESFDFALESVRAWDEYDRAVILQYLMLNGGPD